jgi:asparagine synthase (glutamine-hydrolysing)
MANGVEARAPFMDHQLIEYSSKLPFKLKMQQGPKTIIKNISEKVFAQYLSNYITKNTIYLK